VSPVAAGLISGFGAVGYILALEALQTLLGVAHPAAPAEAAR
jgi:3-dehydroquinate dehydratase